jgi:hypothetical protein
MNIAFMEFLSYCGRNAWVEIIPVMGTYNCNTCCEGNQPEKLGKI